MIDDAPSRPCLGCGHCCLTATCVVGLQLAGEVVHRGVRRCAALVRRGDRYRCALIEAGRVPPDQLAIGAGCSSPLFNAARDALAAAARRKP